MGKVITFIKIEDNFVLEKEKQESRKNNQDTRHKNQDTRNKRL